jgi:tRNA A-37 threonylcarbamoyl transferase component Bud32
MDRNVRLNAHKQVVAQVKRLWKAGICHGDIAWRNIAVSEDGNVMLLDLGLSHMATDAARSEEWEAVERLKWTA